ncbi:SDR family oxidoreductase [Viridibacillus sp. FSL R5-0477]|uniref:Short-chain dehydrogenase/reductase SDR n=1 Tax=Viridibacillus arenosi FSL R5-213 TaxID=1227360 RepID=W4EQL4_9BACL|nr:MULTISPECIES: SDR family oxidoreductase [Viridibacillus]ETT82868.1 short-chain dehydrogenase/reductase SDR [Viridibacillus arenosi FSL R5-213]OMC82182.1 short-chain dehydrogenase [Viridibacillus sp. FSL H8-0123]OMC86339.1 short-chain dehydrogenase [Viridibacillus sp. FSL H7-0596]OMC90757.1 short-chain dehydrogenase [Viridibacillus arenosi]
MAERVVVITGAGSGIGRSTAIKFASKGDKVVVADFNEKGGQETVDMIKAENGEATFVKVDVSKFDQVEAMVEKTVELYGSLDVVFNNAGIGKIIPFLDYTVEDYERVIGVNQHGVFYGMLAAGRKMRDLNIKGVIINTASVFGYLSNQYTFAYQASKGAVRMMCQTGALELAPYGIRVVGVAPGTVDTPIVQGYKDAGLTDKLKGNQMRGDLIKPEAIANAVYLLSLEEADVINGSVVMLDDGYASFK